MSTVTLIQADARKIPLADRSVQCVVTSPPYWGLRDYGTAAWEGGDEACDHVEKRSARRDSPGGYHNSRNDRSGETQPATQATVLPYRDVCGKCGARRVDRQIGLEASPDAYVAQMVEVFREVRRVLRDDGCAFVNLGDSYNSSPSNQNGQSRAGFHGGDTEAWESIGRQKRDIPGLKPKDLCGIPWRVALALQADGWWLRDAIVWAKGEVDEFDVLEGSPMPGSQRDRCTSAYELVFQFAKKARYFFDLEAVKTMSKAVPRNVWRINARPFKGSHFATFAPELVERCVKAGTSERGCCPTCGKCWERVTETSYVPHGPSAKAQQKTTFGERTGGDIEKGCFRPQEMKYGRASRVDTTLGWAQSCPCPPAPPRPCVVFDPFGGAGTVPLVASNLGRRGIMTELSADYIRMARRRIERPHAKPERAARAEHHPLFSGIEH